MIIHMNTKIGMKKKNQMIQQSKNDEEGERLEILTPNKLLTRLPELLPQIKSLK